MRILIVQNLDFLSETHRREFAKIGIVADTAKDNEEGLAYVQFHDYDLIAHVSLASEMRALQFIRSLKTIKCAAPIIVISKDQNPNATISALRLGADDVLPFTIAPEELSVRTLSIIRRSRNKIENTITMGNTAIDLDCRTVAVKNVRCKISPKEFSILEFLLLRQGINSPKIAILNHIYGCNDIPDEKIIDVFICKMRRNLKESGSDITISTVWGVGYSLQLVTTIAKRRVPLLTSDAARH